MSSFTYGQVMEMAEKKCLSCDRLYRGTSYRSGGDVVLYPGKIEVGGTFKVTKSESTVFEPTGYKERGRTMEIWSVIPDEEGEWTRVSPDEWHNVIHQCDEKSTIHLGWDDSDEGMFFVKKSVMESNNGMMEEAFAAIGL